MIEKIQIRYFYLFTALFIAINSVLIANEFFWFFLFPLLVFIGILLFFSLDKLILLIVFLTPLSVNLKDFDLGVGISIPTEPLMFGIMLLFFIKLFSTYKFDKKILRHPLTYAILFNLIWIFITCFTSELPIVSFKYLISRLWFVITFYFLGTLLFKTYKNIKVFIWIYIIPLIGVIIYTIYNHSLYGFMEKPAHWVMTPFFNDHTAYGAILAFFIPVIFGFIFNKDSNKIIRIISLFVFILFSIAIILSFGRAAWISLGIALIVFFILQFKINYKYVLLFIALLVSVFFIYKSEILMKLEKNKQDSSANLVEHVQSISNISSDASNLERINRWQSAFRMFNQRPIFGWGPGTYQFVYAPFQRSREKTIISTNAGEKGNAHSEYIGPLSESGIFGLLTFLGMMITFIYTAVKVYKRTKIREIKLISLLVLLGMITYFTHGFMNNFLDTDKASVPFWGFMAIIVALDIYHSNPKEAEQKEEKFEPNATGN